MTAIQQFGRVESLIIDRANLAELRPELIALQDKIEKQTSELKKFIRLKAAHALLQTSYSELHNQHSQLEKAHSDTQQKLEDLRLLIQKLKSPKNQARPKFDKRGLFNPLNL